MSAQLRVRILPTAVEPVKESLRTIGLSVSAAPISLALVPTTTFKTPFGMPAWSANSAIARAESGVSEAGFITTGQPAASAGAHFLVIIAIGKFQGVIAATTPIGCLITIILRSFEGVGITSPYVLLPSSANHSINDAPYPTSPLASAIGFPCSAVINIAKSS